MFSGIRRVFGLVKVEESATEIEVSGIPADVLARDIGKMWNTERINRAMFSQITSSSIRFPKFFALEVHYILQQIDQYRNAKSTTRTIRSILQGLQESTWLKRLDEEPTTRVDLHALSGLNAKLFPHQDSFIRAYGELTDRYGLDGYLLSARPGTGKAQPLDAPIRIPGGWSTMGEMQVGTKVIAKDGSVTEVTGVFPQGEKPIYRVTFADGRSAECCGEHLWTVRLHGYSSMGGMRVLDTAAIADRLVSSEDPRVHVPLIDPEVRPEKVLPIDPYALGVLIGDGCLRWGRVNISTPDQFIVDELKRILPAELKIEHIADYDYKIIGKDDSVNSYLMAVRELGLAEKLSIDKFIPPDYLDGSIGQRIALLQGLMDTDGTADQAACTSYSTSSKQLAEDVQRLVWSLGGIARITSRVPHYTYNGERREGKLAYRVWIRYRKPSELFRLPRKRLLTNDNGQYVDSLMLRIVAIEPIGMKTAQCIMVAHPDHLYVTSNYIATHNTIMGLALAECLHADLVVVVSPKPAVYRVWVDTVKWLYKRPRAYWVAGEGKPWKNERIVITHYEALSKAMEVVRRIPHQNAVVILDESHNLNEAKSNRTQLFLELGKTVHSHNVLWSSGTPLKAMGYEMIPFLRSIDKLFTDDVERRFMAIFGRASDRALDILRNRIGKISYSVSSGEVIKVAKTYEKLEVKLPDGDEYTLDAIREKMKAFVEERTAFYLKNMKDYKRRFEAGIDAYRQVMRPTDKDKLKRYEHDAAMIAKGFDTRNPEMVEAAKFCNLFEKKVLIPSIPDKAIRDAFADARAVVKYLSLRVMGEALGKIVGKARSEVHVKMANAIDWKAIADKSAKKVLVFTSYVEVAKAADAAIKKAGYKTILVYGDTSSNLAGLVEQFDKDPDAKFLVATYQTLSTAVPLTMADVTVFINQNWRSFERDQAEARTARIGQDKGVTYIDVLLDTGKEPNISTRAKDIMEWSKAMVEALGMGEEGLTNETISAELNKDYNAGAMEAYAPPTETAFSQAMESFLDDRLLNERSEIVGEPSLEEVKLMSERNDGLGKRILIRLLGMVAYIPKLTFEKSDVDMAVVEKMKKYPELLKVIDTWIFEPDQALLPKLKEAQRVFSPMQKPITGKLYRGFSATSMDQDTMGVTGKNFFGGAKIMVKPGDKRSYVARRALSFTFHRGTASTFGGAVISIDSARYRSRLLNISLEMCYAIFDIESTVDHSKIPYYTTYGESILLPSDQPIEFTVESVNGKVASKEDLDEGENVLGLESADPGIHVSVSGMQPEAPGDDRSDYGMAVQRQCGQSYLLALGAGTTRALRAHAADPR